MEIFKLFGSILVDNDKANKSIQKTDSKAKQVAKSLGGGIKTAVKWGAALTAAGAAAGGALVAATNKAAEAGDRIDKLSQRLGLSREGFQEWDFALSQAGVSIDSMQMGMKTLAQRMDDALEGTGKGSEMFDKLGISIDESMSQEEAFNQTITALQKMEDGVTKAALAQELFGRNGQELLPLLNSEAGSVDELKAKARELGLVMSDEAVDAAVVYTDTMDQLKRTFSVAFQTVAIEVMPILQKFFDLIIQNMPVIRDVMAKIIGFISDRIEEFSVFWEENGQGIIDFTMKAFNLISGIVESSMKVIQGVIDVVMGVIKGDWEQVWNGLSGIVTGGFELAKKALSFGIDAMQAILMRAVEGFFNLGRMIIDGVIDGIKAGFENVKEVIGETAEAIKDKFKEVLGIHSPSKVFEEFGKFVNEGFAKGMEENKDKSISATQLMVNSIVEVAGSIGNGLSLAMNIASAKFDLLKTKLGDNSDQAKLLREKLLSLQEQMEIQNQKVDLAQVAYDKMKEVKGELSEETQRLYLELLEEQKAQAELQTSVDETNNSLQDQIDLKRELTADDLIKSGNKKKAKTGYAIKGLEAIYKSTGTITNSDLKTAGLIDGSHAKGLAHVPYDGYVAELHQGEKIVPAKDQEERTSQVFNININVQSISEAMKEIQVLQKKIAPVI